MVRSAYDTPRGSSRKRVKEHLDRACEKVGAHGRKALVARLFVDAYLPKLDARGARAGYAVR